jgi:hypothetical protein
VPEPHRRSGTIAELWGSGMPPQVRMRRRIQLAFRLSNEGSAVGQEAPDSNGARTRRRSGGERSTPGRIGSSDGFGDHR